MRLALIIAIAVAATIGIFLVATLFFVPGANTLSAVSESYSNPIGYQKVNVTVNGFTIVTDVAATEDEKMKGLDVRNTMSESQGMLFPFPIENTYGFWMKGMKFPIDIIWINADKKVVHIENSLPPCTGSDLTCPIHTPAEKAMYVLETTAGFCDKHQVTEGTPVQFTLE